MNIMIRSEDTRYNDIRQATIDDMGQELFDKYHKDTGKRWLDIARVWDKVYNHNKHFVLTSVVHKIMRGVYPYEESDPKFVHLLELIEEELLRDGEAFRAWDKWRPFENLYDGTVNSCVSFGTSGIEAHFIEHYGYLNARAQYLIRHSKKKSFKQYLMETEYKAYEEMVKILIPAASSWTREQWGNDLVLASELKTLYGIDYGVNSQTERNYGRMICLFNERRTNNTPADIMWYATNITEMPWTIVKLLWPENTEFEIANLLIKTYNFLLTYEAAGQPLQQM